ncbi:MAG TPA: metal-binding protein [Lachnospiraceae bacterium]|nr:metal-binding protein [Lachnospiraceae bacterium]
MDNSHRFFQNNDCKYFPCHKGLTDFNCLFCYCPMYNRTDCPGNPTFVEKNGKTIKVCTNCNFPHNPANYDKIIEILKSTPK